MAQVLDIVMVYGAAMTVIRFIIAKIYVVDDRSYIDNYCLPQNTPAAHYIRVCTTTDYRRLYRSLISAI
jgi:hypothetical protein